MRRLLAILCALSFAFFVEHAASKSKGECRCRAPDPCFDQVPFAQLNASIGGRLVPVLDELDACLDSSVHSQQCQADLNRTDQEFFYTGQVGGYMHTGLACSWNISHNLAAYAVAAETESDIQFGVIFAAKHNLRLAVKGTGHDWLGRSGSHPDYEGSLMIWTHNRKKIDWHDGGFVAEGCPTNTSTPAVTLDSGIQFSDLYPVAEHRGRFVNAGGCTSVGIGGCTLGGCFGTFSQKMGPSASNLLQAKVVLADGTLVVTSQCSHPDLFWALRGGGAGFGVVTEFTMRTYRTPEWMTSVSYTGSVESGNSEDWQKAAVEVLRTVDQATSGRTGWNGGWGIPHIDSTSFHISLSTYEGNSSDGEALLQPLAAWVAAQNHTMAISGKLSSQVKKRGSSWIGAPAPEGQRGLPWDIPHHDTEIGTEHMVSMSKWLTRTALREGPGDRGLNKMASALINVSNLAATGLLGPLPGGVGIDMEKVQGGATPETVTLFHETSQNPVLLDTVGFITSQWRVPALPQLPPSSTVLKTLWPRLQEYAITQKSDVLHPVCEAGAAGDEAKAKECMEQWAEREKAVVRELNVLKDEMLRRFPVENGCPPDSSTADSTYHGTTVRLYSGSYWNEADYYEPKWQTSFWGADNYAKLLIVKHRYDPDDVFVCHHCVGSETWSADGNCRNEPHRVRGVADSPAESAAATPPPPIYPIPSDCEFVWPATTGRNNINKAYGHYYCKPQGNATRKLFIYLQGTGTNDYTSAPKTASSIGFHAVMPDWDNHPCAGAACQMQLDKKHDGIITPAIANCTHNLQMSRFVGSVDMPVSTIGEESIVGRVVALLTYLDKAQPTLQWGQFIAPNNNLHWEKVTIMGHSRGSAYPALTSKLFPAQRAIMTGGDGNATGPHNPVPWQTWPLVMRAEDLYSLNPIFTSKYGTGSPVSPWNVDRQQGNGSFSLADLQGDAATVERHLAAKLKGARAIWDENVCANTTSSHMCIGPCDAWQPRDPVTKLPILEPVWKYLYTNEAPPSAEALAYQIVSDCSESWCHFESNNTCNSASFEEVVSSAMEMRHSDDPQPKVIPSCCSHGGASCKCENCFMNGNCSVC